MSETSESPVLCEFCGAASCPGNEPKAVYLPTGPELNIRKCPAVKCCRFTRNAAVRSRFVAFFTERDLEKRHYLLAMDPDMIREDDQNTGSPWFGGLRQNHTANRLLQSNLVIRGQALVVRHKHMPKWLKESQLRFVCYGNQDYGGLNPDPYALPDLA